MGNLNDYIATHFSVPSPGAVNDKLIAFFSRMYAGLGTPEAVVTADTGSFYFDFSNGKFYSKVTGDATTNTGWSEVVGGGGGGGGVTLEQVQDAIDVHADARTAVTGTGAVSAHGADAQSKVQLVYTPGNTGGRDFISAEGSPPETFYSITPNDYDTWKAF